VGLGRGLAQRQEKEMIFNWEICCDALLEDLLGTCKTILALSIYLYQFSNAIQIDRWSTSITDHFNSICVFITYFC